MSTFGLTVGRLTKGPVSFRQLQVALWPIHSLWWGRTCLQATWAQFTSTMQSCLLCLLILHDLLDNISPE